MWTQAVDAGNRDMRGGGTADNNALPTAAHTHTIPSQGGGGGHAHAFNNFDIKFADVIIATKD